MALVINEEQAMLKHAAKQFCSESAPVAELRALRDSESDIGFEMQTWRGMVELGWAGINIPEEYGGVGFGYVGLGIVMEECGRTLTASPLMSTAVLGSSAILLAGSDAQKSEILPQIAQGEIITALALEEYSHHDPYNINAHTDGDTISGSKVFVLDGHVADKIIVLARSQGEPGDRVGLSWVMVDADTHGVDITRTIMADSRNAANIKFSGAKCEVLGTLGTAETSLDRILDIGRIALSAEMLGGVQEAFDRTLEYLKVREQFGVPIGSFQALKHRAAEMFCEIELSKSVVIAALSALDESSDDVAALASMAKARLSDTYNHVTNEAIQLHGGIGTTDEHEIGFFLKRSRLCEHTLGTAAWHRNRYAELEKY